MNDKTMIIAVYEAFDAGNNLMFKGNTGCDPELEYLTAGKLIDLITKKAFKDATGKSDSVCYVVITKIYKI